MFSVIITAKLIQRIIMASGRQIPKSIVIDAIIYHQVIKNQTIRQLAENISSVDKPLEYAQQLIKGKNALLKEHDTYLRNEIATVSGYRQLDRLANAYGPTSFISKNANSLNDSINSVLTALDSNLQTNYEGKDTKAASYSIAVIEEEIRRNSFFSGISRDELNKETQVLIVSILARAAPQVPVISPTTWWCSCLKLRTQEGQPLLTKH